MNISKRIYSNKVYSNNKISNNSSILMNKSKRKNSCRTDFINRVLYKKKIQNKFINKNSNYKKFSYKNNCNNKWKKIK